MVTCFLEYTSEPQSLRNCLFTDRPAWHLSNLGLLAGHQANVPLLLAASGSDVEHGCVKKGYSIE